jgi:hypothetical protein
VVLLSLNNCHISVSLGSSSFPSHTELLQQSLDNRGIQPPLIFMYEWYNTSNGGGTKAQRWWCSTPAHGLEGGGGGPAEVTNQKMFLVGATRAF